MAIHGYESVDESYLKPNAHKQLYDAWSKLTLHEIVQNCSFRISRALTSHLIDVVNQNHCGLCKRLALLHERTYDFFNDGLYILTDVLSALI